MMPDVGATGDAPVTVEEKKITVILLRAYWPDGDKRVNEGDSLDVSMDDALKLIEAGAAKRANP